MCRIYKQTSEKKRHTMQKDKEELERIYLEMKFSASQLSDNIPQDIREQINQNLQTAHKTLYVTLPACDDLTIALKELTFSKYPEFKDNDIPHLGQLVSNICDELANSIVKNVNDFLIDLENKNTPFKSEKQLQNLVSFFATPLDESENPEDQSPNGKTSAESNRIINNNKKEFLDTTLKVLFHYFEKPLNNLDAEGWQVIGVSLGYTFLVYFKRCYIMLEELAEGILIRKVGISYEDLEKKLCPELMELSEKEWLQNL